MNLPAQGVCCSWSLVSLQTSRHFLERSYSVGGNLSTLPHSPVPTSFSDLGPGLAHSFVLWYFLLLEVGNTCSSLVLPVVPRGTSPGSLMQTRPHGKQLGEDNAIRRTPGVLKDCSFLPKIALTQALKFANNLAGLSNVQSIVI